MNKIEKKIINELYRRNRKRNHIVIRHIDEPDNIVNLQRPEYKLFLNNIEIVKSLLDKGYLEFKPMKLASKLEFLSVSQKGMEYVSNKNIQTTKELVNNRIKANEKSKRMDKVRKYKASGNKRICCKCLKINVPCEHDEESKFFLPKSARPPRKNASKKRWKDFMELFFK